MISFHETFGRRLGVLCLLAVTLSACGSGGHEGVTSPGVSPELKHSWEVAFNRGDVDAIVNLYSDDATLVMTGSDPVTGHEAIRKLVSDMIKSGAKLKIDTTRNIGSGEVAYVYGPYSVFDHEGGKTIEAGTYVEVWRKHGQDWRIDLDVNSTGPAAGNVSAPPDSQPAH